MIKISNQNQEINENIDKNNSSIVKFSEDECKKIHEIVINIKELDKIPFKKHKWEKEIEKIIEWQINGFNYKVLNSNARLIK